MSETPLQPEKRARGDMTTNVMWFLDEILK